MNTLLLLAGLPLLGAPQDLTTARPTGRAGDGVGSDVIAVRRVLAPYFYVDADTRATIRLVNTRCVLDVVRVRLRLDGAVPVELGVFTVPSSGFLDIPIGDVRESGAGGTWGDGSRPGSVWGSVEVETENSLGWVETLAADKSLVVGTELGMVPPAAQIAALWWKPTPETRTLVALQNHADAAVSVRAELLVDGAWTHHDTIAVGAREAHLLALPAGLPATGAVRYSADDALPVLTATMIMIDEARGFSSHFGFRNAALRSKVRHLAGLTAGVADPALGFRAGLLLEPSVLIANPTRESARIEVQASNDARATARFDLTLAPGESRELDLYAQSGRPWPAGLLGLTVRSSRPEVLCEAVSVTRTGADAFRYSFHSPFENPLARAHDPGGSSGPGPHGPGFVSLQFDVRGDRNTHVVVRNVTDAAQTAVVFFSYNGDGDFQDTRFELALAPRATQVLDVRELQRASTGAEGGQRFDAETGYVVASGDFRALEVAASVFDPLRGTCIEGGDSDVCVECDSRGGDCRLVSKYPSY